MWAISGCCIGRSGSPLHPLLSFINACYQMKKCFIGDSFSYFESTFCYHSTYFFDFMCSSWKVLKGIKIFWTILLKPFIRYQGKNFDLFWIWRCFLFFLHCLVQPKQLIRFLVPIYVIRIRFWIFQKVSFYFVWLLNIALYSVHKFHFCISCSAVLMYCV